MWTINSNNKRKEPGGRFVLQIAATTIRGHAAYCFALESHGFLSLHYCCGQGEGGTRRVAKVVARHVQHSL